MLRGFGFGLTLGILAALVGRLATAEGASEQWREARAEAESAAVRRESTLRARHQAARRDGRLPADD